MCGAGDRIQAKWGCSHALKGMELSQATARARVGVSAAGVWAHPLKMALLVFGWHWGFTVFSLGLTAPTKTCCPP